MSDTPTNDTLINFDDLIYDVICAAKSLEAGHEWGVGSAGAERHLKKCYNGLRTEIDRLRLRISELEAAAAWVSVEERLPGETEQQMQSIHTGEKFTLTRAEAFGRA